MRWLIGLSLLASGVAIAVSGRRARSINLSQGLGNWDPFDSKNTKSTKKAKSPKKLSRLRVDEAECLIIGREHRFNPDAPYRVCITENQRKVLFGGKKPGKKLGCGVFACAYASPKKGRVVKFTRDSEDVAALIEAQKTGVVPKLYDVYSLKDGAHSIRTDEESPMYALVLERLRTIPVKDRDDLNDSLYNIADVSDGISAKAYCEAHKCSEVDREVANIVEKLYKIGIKWGDVHAGNIGYDAKGKLKALDLGLTSTQLRKRLKILAGLGQLKHQSIK